MMMCTLSPETLVTGGSNAFRFEDYIRGIALGEGTELSQPYAQY